LTLKFGVEVRTWNSKLQLQTIVLSHPHIKAACRMILVFEGNLAFIKMTVGLHIAS